ncbi:hypothetical protein KC324_g82 [Hortaea werneckii]|nr:hypothetical protein KC324_g82 [Hortaea werneckii]
MSIELVLRRNYLAPPSSKGTCVSHLCVKIHKFSTKVRREKDSFRVSHPLRSYAAPADESLRLLPLRLIFRFPPFLLYALATLRCFRAECHAGFAAGLVGVGFEEGDEEAAGLGLEALEWVLASSLWGQPFISRLYKDRRDEVDIPRMRIQRMIRVMRRWLWSTVVSQLSCARSSKLLAFVMNLHIRPNAFCSPSLSTAPWLPGSRKASRTSFVKTGASGLTGERSACGRTRW